MGPKSFTNLFSYKSEKTNYHKCTIAFLSNTATYPCMNDLVLNVNTRLYKRAQSNMADGTGSKRRDYDHSKQTNYVQERIVARGCVDFNTMLSERNSDWSFIRRIEKLHDGLSEKKRNQIDVKSV